MRTRLLAFVVFLAVEAYRSFQMSAPALDVLLSTLVVLAYAVALEIRVSMLEEVRRTQRDKIEHWRSAAMFHVLQRPDWQRPDWQLGGKDE